MSVLSDEQLIRLRDEAHVKVLRETGSQAEADAASLRAVADAAIAADRAARAESVGADFHAMMGAAAEGRYHVGPSSICTIYLCAVYAGAGTQELYRGSRSSCLRVARILTGAFLDGGFVATKYTAPPVAPVAPEYDRNAYEELRAIIDGGSESMTHSDAVEWCKRHADADWMPVKPAAPVVPEEMSPANVPMYWMDESSNACAYAAGFNACRRAMLAAAPAPSQEPTT